MRGAGCDPGARSARDGIERFYKRQSPATRPQAWNLTQSLADVAADGFKIFSTEQYQQRLQVCDGCDRRRESQCLECGCCLPDKVCGPGFRLPVGELAGTGDRFVTSFVKYAASTNKQGSHHG